MSLHYYVLPFTLTLEVDDLGAANEYLQCDDMTPILKDDLSYEKAHHLGSRDGAPTDPDNIVKIRWSMVDSIKGVVELKTVNALTDSEKEYIEDWIHGQCTDGLGEGFQQQDFFVRDDYDYDEDNGDYYEEYEEMPEFESRYKLIER